jgi:hypothetical protein
MHGSFQIVGAYQSISRHIIVIILIPTICFLLLINPVGLSRFGLYASLALMVGVHLFHVLKLTVYMHKTSDVSFLDILIYLCSAEVLPIYLAAVFLIRQFLK